MSDASREAVLSVIAAALEAAPEDLIAAGKVALIYDALLSARLVRTPHPYAAFATRLAELGAPAPWPARDAVLFDAGGAAVVVVDVDNERRDADAHEIAQWIACAVNTCAGFKLELPK